MEQMGNEFGNTNEAAEAALHTAFNLTYKMFVGKLTIKDVLHRYRNIELMYDPYELDQKEFISIVEDMLDHYIDLEEYEKCAKLRDIISDKKSYKLMIKSLILDPKDPDVMPMPNGARNTSDPVDYLIQKLKHMGQKRLEDRFRDMLREAKINEITDPEIWTLMSHDDRDIFVNYSKFARWITGLTTTIRDEYIGRLLENKPLIPKGQEIDMIFAQLDAAEEDVDYTNNVIISYLDDKTIISHSNLEKIAEIRSILQSNGIQDIETRLKNHGNGYTVYSLVYIEGDNKNPYIRRKKD